MKLFKIAFISVLSGTTFGAVEDEVACAFNAFRRRYGVEPLKISTNLLKSAKEIVAASHKAGKTQLILKDDKTIIDRMVRAGYEPSDAAALGGQGYKYPRDFAAAMIKSYPDRIKNRELKHIGFAKSNAFSNLDMGDSYNDNEPVYDPIGC